MACAGLAVCLPARRRMAGAGHRGMVGSAQQHATHAGSAHSTELAGGGDSSVARLAPCHSWSHRTDRPAELVRWLGLSYEPGRSLVAEWSRRALSDKHSAADLP